MMPSGRGRPGPHPLAALIAPYLARPTATLVTAGPADPGCRDLNPGRFRATQPLPGAAVLLLDDTWTTGASAQSAAIALRAAGARHVAVVVLGRHVSPAGPGGGAGEPFRLEHCVVHRAGRAQ
jgi:orotate phosphoribosyltransferase